MIDTSLKQAGLLVFCALNKTWEAVQSCGFSNHHREAGWAVYKGCLVSSRCLRYQATRSHHKNSCVKCLCVGRTVPLHWVLWNIPLGLWLLSNKPSFCMGWRGSSVWEWEREEICGSFPFIFTVVLLKTDMHFPSRLLAPEFATRRGGRRKTARPKASD